VRTTLTLDEDVARALARRAAETRRSFKETVNDVLRRGLRADPSQASFTVTTFSSQIRPGLDLTKALALASSLEDDETLRKIELGK
jgi:plasmid stability protein